MNLEQIFTKVTHASQDATPELLLTYLKDWCTISVTGKDSKTYLNGQLTCDVVTLAKDKASFGAHCDAKGKVWSVFRLFHHQQGYALFQTKSAIDEAVTQLKKYAVFSQIEIKQSDDLCFGLIGSQAKEFIAHHATPRDPENQLAKADDSQTNVYDLLGGSCVEVSPLRYLICIPQENAEQLVKLFEEGHKVAQDMWDCYDVLDAHPRVNLADQASHIPQAFNLQALGGISFTKGCYTGQETVARAKYRGINKRALFILESQEYPAALELQGMLEVERQVGENWRSAGHFIAQYQYFDPKLIGLVILNNDLEPDTSFRLAAYPDIKLSFKALPYSLEE